ncbi:MAG: peptidylprolyl isomerase, partial [Planctomycetales bacterium]|nr:peptidylprolyl isomerase [Planctomycetales bacterium]
LVEQILPSSIESKIVYLDFQRKVKPEQLDTIRTSIYEQFDEKQLPLLIEKANVKNVAELEAKMRAVGTTLDKTRRMFFEQVAAREAIRKRSEDKHFTVTPDQLLSYYQEHMAEYEIPARAKWEQLTVELGRYPSEQTKAEAFQKIAKMGNAVYYGAPFAEVAKRDSDGPTSLDGGQYDWTTPGSLASAELDRAVFSLPLNELSEIIEDDNGFHIIRVTQREDASRVPFEGKAQSEIRQKLEEEHKTKLAQEYIDRLKESTYVWNYFEQQEQTAGAANRDAFDR